jgi:hypothetical protein
VTRACTCIIKAVADVRRRAFRELYGRGGKADDPWYGSPTSWTRTWRPLSGEQFAKIIETLGATCPS